MSSLSQPLYTKAINQSRLGKNWKFITGNKPPEVYEHAPSKSRPPINKDPNLKYPGNAFRANPIKHWRKQSVETTPPNVGGNTNVLVLIDQVFGPGGTTQTPVTDVSACDGSCVSTKLTADWRVTYPSPNEPKVGREYPPGFASREVYNNPCSDLSGNWAQCFSVCDPAKTARRRTQYPSAVNTDKSKPKYFQNASNYLHARCRTFKQNLPNGVKINPENDPNCKCNSCNCTGRIFNPNNPKFAQQGAVSSSSAIVRKKLNTINTFANGFSSNPNSNYAPEVAASYAYSGRPEAPFTIKNKFFNCNQNIGIFRRTGNPTTACVVLPPKRFFNSKLN